MDPLVVVFFVVIAACVPLIAYLLPQDPALERWLADLGRWRRRKRQPAAPSSPETNGVDQ